MQDAIFAPVAKKKPPFAFVLDELRAASPSTRPMFGCTAIYVEDKIVMVLRDRPTSPADNGVWIATTREHHASLLPEMPSMRSISVFGPKITGWQNLPKDALSFEDDVLRACALIRAKDPRIGKVPMRRRRAAASSPKARKRSRARRSRSRRTLRGCW